jgi:hypothetical protein
MQCFGVCSVYLFLLCHMLEVVSLLSPLQVNTTKLSPFLHANQKWKFCPSDVNFWRERAKTVIIWNSTELHSLVFSKTKLSTHGFQLLEYNEKLSTLVEKTRNLLNNVLKKDKEDPFQYHVRDYRFNGPNREDVLEVCADHSYRNYARTVNPQNVTASVKNMRKSLKELSEQLEVLATKVYAQYRKELAQYSNINATSGITSQKNSLNRYETLASLETSPIQLYCEEVFASHSAVEGVSIHSDTDNDGPLDTVVVWIPLNQVQSNPFVIQGQSKWYGTHGLNVGEALMYLTPGPDLASPAHGTAMLPTDLEEDLVEYKTDHGVSFERRRLLFVLRVANASNLR